MSKVVKAPASEDGEDSGDETSSATSSVIKRAHHRARHAGTRPRTAFDRRRDGPLARPRWPVAARRRQPRVATGRTWPIIDPRR